MTSPLTALLGAVDVADPYPLWQSLLDGPPLLAPDGTWAVLTRSEDCAALLRSPVMSSDQRNSLRWQQAIAPRLSAAELDRLARGRTFLFRDPPEHTRLRRLVSKAFTARTVERLAPLVQALTDEMLDAAAARGTLEVIDDLAYPLPVAVISHLLGVPLADHARFAGWSTVLARSLDGLVDEPNPARVAEQRRAAEEFRAYIGDLADERRTAPHEDLITALVQAEEAGDRLTTDELVSTVMLLLIAGHETTVSLIGNGVLALLRVPGLLAQVRAAPDLATGVVEEVLRLDPPVQMTMRTALEDVAVPGGTLRRGGTAVLLLAAAGRDEAAFQDPQRFDPDRGDTRHLAFGGGIHFCLGAPLARLEGRIALASLAARLSEPQLVELAYRENRVLRGPARLVLADPGFAPPAGA